MRELTIKEMGMVSGGGPCSAGHGPVGGNGVLAGYEPVGSDGRMMRDAISGALYLTPGYQAQVDALNIDFIGVAIDLGTIALGSVGGAGLGAVGAGLLVGGSGLGAVADLHNNPTN